MGKFAIGLEWVRDRSVRSLAQIQRENIPSPAQQRTTNHGSLEPKVGGAVQIAAGMIALPLLTPSWGILLRHGVVGYAVRIDSRIDGSRAYPFFGLNRCMGERGYAI